MANLDLKNIDVIVIGAGNAASNAAMAAHLEGAKVLMWPALAALRLLLRIRAAR